MSLGPKAPEAPSMAVTLVFKKQMDYLEAKYHADIRFLNIPDLALSSSEIRRRVREHQSIRFMVPEGVREYIEEHQLYCR